MLINYIRRCHICLSSEPHQEWGLQTSLGLEQPFQWRNFPWYPTSDSPGTTWALFLCSPARGCALGWNTHKIHLMHWSWTCTGCWHCKTCRDCSWDGERLPQGFISLQDLVSLSFPGCGKVRGFDHRLKKIMKPNLLMFAKYVEISRLWNWQN